MVRSYTPALNPSGEQDAWKVPQTVNKLLQGKSNNVGDVTFTVLATTTLIKNGLIGPDSHIDLSPTTANARTALTTAYISARIKGQATITHAATAAVDQIFTYTVTN